MKRIIITGGTGFLGLGLAAHLSQNGFIPVLIARNKPGIECQFEFHQWDGVNLDNWVKSFPGAYAVVNLTGKSVDCIKTPDNCDLILRSRVDSTKVIGVALNEINDPPKIWIQMSTAHIYGDPPSQICTETSSTGYGLAPFVGKSWEQALLDNLPEGTREVRLRTSFVLGRTGGSLQKLKRIVKLRLGGKVGNGKQGISWIHQYDMNEIILCAITNDNYCGVYIASSPNPVSSKIFMHELRKAMKVRIGLAAPAFITRFGAKYLFKTDPDLALYGRYVSSERLEKEGFNFRFKKIDEALRDLI